MKKNCCCPEQPGRPEQAAPCCPSGSTAREKKIQVVPRVSTQLTGADKWGAVKARWGIGRMNYKVEPGIYAVGNPDENAIVLVSANYKLSFDALRKELAGLDAWILVLDTGGVNVWCAAGKGTFGSDELVRRIDITGLKEIVKHRKLIVPQLGAPGVSAHRVKGQSGFTVIYGPVRAADIPAFLRAGMRATPGMRRVRFSFKDRARVAPIELVQGAPKFLLIMAAFFLLSGFNSSGYSLNTAVPAGLRAVWALLLAYLAGAAAAPLLLPWLPGRSFSFKGFVIGVLFFGFAFFTALRGASPLETTAWFLLISSIASFLTMNFTGASTYTSLSGVKKEMRYAVPAQITAAAVGILLWLAGRFV
ncbi:MAG: mercury methylation corrinoid protein HgcA [Candidatus Aminicenantes bacterium]|nr:mercury methylation corrinoid protein HgcA [Candidatus Aminicenantes bacterium]